MTSSGLTSEGNTEGGGTGVDTIIEDDGWF